MLTDDSPIRSPRAIVVELGGPYVGERLDKALTLALGAAGQPVSRSRVLQAFAEDAVRLNGRPCKPSMRVEAELRIEVALPDLPPLAHAHPEDLGLVVLYEDPHILVVDKPPGMAVHGGPGHDEGTLVNAVLHHLGCAPSDLPTLTGNGPERPGIVHRLDRDTSGVMVVAKTWVGQEGLAGQFREHSLRREYLGVVRGVPRFSQQHLETWHGRDPRQRQRFSPQVNDGRKAITDVMVVERFDDAALLRFRLHTGRTHQIRMHCRMLGHPIVGDVLYGNPSRGALAQRIAQTINRQALHAALLGILHPVSGEPLLFESPPPTDFAELLTLLRQPLR